MAAEAAETFLDNPVILLYKIFSLNCKQVLHENNKTFEFIKYVSTETSVILVCNYQDPLQTSSKIKVS